MPAILVFEWEPGEQKFLVIGDWCVCVYVCMYVHMMYVCVYVSCFPSAGSVCMSFVAPLFLLALPNMVPLVRILPLELHSKVIPVLIRCQ